MYSVRVDGGNEELLKRLNTQSGFPQVEIQIEDAKAQEKGGRGLRRIST